MRNRYVAALGVGLLFAVSGAHAATLVADYEFNGNLNSSVGGAPALTAVDPGGVASFSGGQYSWGGSASPPSSQGGLSFDNSGGLLTSNSYSISLRFLFDSGSGWRRIVDVQNRTSDNGFYVDPSNRLDVYPVTGSTTNFTAGTFHSVILTVNNGTVKGYLDNVQQFNATTNVMDIDANNVVNLFLDNTVGGGQGEWSSGTIDYAKFYDGVISVSSVPEASTWAMMLLGFAGLGFASYRAARKTAVA